MPTASGFQRIKSPDETFGAYSKKRYVKTDVFLSPSDLECDRNSTFLLPTEKIIDSFKPKEHHVFFPNNYDKNVFYRSAF